MATFRSVKEYQQHMQKFAENLVFEADKLDKKTTQKIKKTAKKLAPRKTGRTIQGIKNRKVKKANWVVESTVPGSFKQNLFANRNPPYRVLKFRKKNVFYKNPQQVTYGKSAKTPGGKPIVWTGKPGFWDLAVRDSIPGYRNQIKQLTRRAKARS